MLLHDRRPLRFGTAEEQTAVASSSRPTPRQSRRPWGSPGLACRSWPAPRPSASSPSVRLRRTRSARAARNGCSSTVASSMGVALENARLFSETKRLAETDERAAELAIINSVQEGLVENLEMQAMYDLVGDKIREDLRCPGRGHRHLRHRTGSSFPYTISAASACRTRRSRSGSRLCRALCWRRAAAAHRRRDPLGGQNLPQAIQGEPAKSVLIAPMTVAGEVRGRISIQNLDRFDAFSDADVRLLSTLAAGLSVALENARLFDETKRLLTEADERAAEDWRSSTASRRGWLRTGHAGDVRPRRRQDPGDLRCPGRRHRHSRRRREDGALPYTIERGVRFPDEPTVSAAHRSCARSSGRKRALLWNDVVAWQAEHGDVPVIQGEQALSVIIAPLMSGREVQGRISLQERLIRISAFTDADALALHLAGSLSVALENARLFDETKQVLTETDERAPPSWRLSTASRRAGPEPGHAGDVRPRRRQDPGDLRRPGRRHRDPRPAPGDHGLPLRDRARHAVPDERCRSVRSCAGSSASGARSSGTTFLRGRPSTER